MTTTRSIRGFRVGATELLRFRAKASRRLLKSPRSLLFARLKPSIYSWMPWTLRLARQRTFQTETESRRTSRAARYRCWLLFMNMSDVTKAQELTYFWASSAHDLVPSWANSVIFQHTVIAVRMRRSCTNQTLPSDGFARMIPLLRQTV